MTKVEDLLPGGISLSELAMGERDGISLEKRCGRAGLVLSVVGMTKARILEKTRTHDVEPMPGEPTGFYVVPVKPSDGSASSIIRVGRAASNDVVINDVTLSKLHAFFRVTASGFTLEDGGSKNGTFLGENPVAPRGNGPPVPVPSRSPLRFGSVKLQFLLVDDLRQLMKQVVS